MTERMKDIVFWVVLILYVIAIVVWLPFEEGLEEVAAAECTADCKQRLKELRE